VAKPGPVRKPAAQRQRRNRAEVVTLVPASSHPSPPEGLLPQTHADWATLWDADVARAIQPHHLSAVRRLFRFRDQFERAMAIAETALVVKGSTGQMRSNPLLETAQRLDASILRLENELGLTPLAQARLGVATGSAQLTLEELNRIAREGTTPAEDDPVAALLLAGADERRAEAADPRS
jgi:hypothetical protein